MPAVAAALSAGALLASGLVHPHPSSSADSVTPACRAPGNAKACAVALDYLAALDLDRTRAACAFLDASTLEAAGGMRGCMKTLALARGIRIHYAIFAANPSPLGTTIRFTTRGASATPIRQQMLVTPAGRILAIVPEPWSR